MDHELWARAKSLYLEASLAEKGCEAYLSHVEGFDQEVLSFVRELLQKGQTPGPRIDQPCWSPIHCQQLICRAFEIGQILLGRFEIAGFLGAGGMGEVYKAFDHQQLIFVALKTLLPALSSDKAALETLRNELNTARSVTCPNICRLYDFHMAADSSAPPFVSMELLEGETLAQYLQRNGPLRPKAAMPIVEHMILALEAAHGMGIVHRDFKSANVMLTQNATTAVVMDFGLARELAPGANLETTLASEMYAGTPAYMAPEQLRGSRATFASDLHSFGVVLFEMVTGRRPFEGGGPLEIASRRLNEDAPSPRKYAPSLDRSWERAILLCLEADKRRRPPSAGAVRELLAQRPPLLWHRRKAMFALGLALPSMMGGELWWLAAQSRRGVAIDVFDVENRTGDPADDFLCRGTTSELIRRLSESDHISVIPIRGTLRAAGVRSKERFVLSGALSNTKDGKRLEMKISDSIARTETWSKTYNQQRFSDLLRLQKDIADDASKEVISRAGLFRGDLFAKWRSSSKGTSPTSNIAAFDLYLRGNSLQQESTEESLRAAIDSFERAIALDPHFALALASLAECHVALLNYGSNFDDAIVSKARDYAQRAMREDPLLAEAHAVMGEIAQIDWDWAAAEDEYNRALRLKPNFAKAIRWRSGLVLQFGDFDEAIAGLEKAFRIDPYDRGAVSTYGMALIFAGRLQEAIAMMEREIRDRDMEGARFNLGLAYILLAKHSGRASATDQYNKALAQARRIASMGQRSRSETSDRLYALVYSARGDTTQAAPYLKRLEEEVASRRVSPGANAIIYVAQRRLDDAQTALERATILRDRFVLYLRVNPLLKDLQGQPRFEELIQKLRLK